MLNKNLYIISSPEDYSEKEKLYLDVRKYEKRLLSDEEVAVLPNVKKNSVYEGEWKIRKDSSEKLIKYITKKIKEPVILEIGCGNGWLASQLATIKDSKVDAIDLNFVELEQAARVFDKEDLSFFYCDILNDKISSRKYDVIVLAASIQYFPDTEFLLYKLMESLEKDGEIHSIDSHFYTQKTVLEARQRTVDYYSKIGFSPMKSYYFHPTFEQLNGFSYCILNRFPGYRIISLFQPKSYLYFPWIKVVRQERS